ALWDKILRSAYEYAEPGVLFTDRLNRLNTPPYCAPIAAPTPCGEIPPPPYGACAPGSANLPAFGRAPSQAPARLHSAASPQTARTATRMRDDVLEVTRYPLPRQAERVRASRRIGLGVTGLADALVMLGLRYDSDEGRATAASILRAIRDTAYAASIDLARE